MKITSLICAITCTGFQLVMANDVKSQNLDEVKVKIELKNEPLKSAFRKIERQTEFRFAYNKTQVDVYNNVSLQKGEYTVQQALGSLLADTKLSFKTIRNNIVIFSDQVEKYDPPVSNSGSTSLMVDGTVTGKVTNEKGEPLSGASIALVNTDKGTAANNTGEFTLNNVKPGKYSIQVSAVGYQNLTQTVNVRDGESVAIVFTLKDVNAAMNEVVVTGYSRQSKRDVTGAASTISSAVIEKSPVTDVTGVLQGRVAGISVDAQGGPGASQVVRLRGVGSFGNNDPLYVIDGVQIRMGTSDGSQDVSALINPNDIESITVLKDPSLTGLYGAEGSNGVIVITTKTGKQGAPKLEYSSYIGYQKAVKFPSFVSPQDYANSVYASYANSTPAGTPADGNWNKLFGNGATPVIPDYFIENSDVGGSTGLGVAANDPAANPSLYNFSNYRILKVNQAGTNWFKAMFRQSFIQNHQLSLSGATDKSSYSLGLNYLDDNGIMLGTFFKRFSLRVNTEFKIKPWIKVGENFQFSFGSGNTSNYGHRGDNGGINGLYQLSPLQPTYDIAGNISGTKAGTLLGQGNNPLVNPIINAPNSKSYSEAAIGSAFIDIEPIRGLVFESRIGGQLFPYQYNYFTQPTPQQFFSTTVNQIGEGSGYVIDWRWTNKVSYSTTINKIHRITAFAAYEARRYTSRTIDATKGGLLYTTPAYQYLSSGTINPTANGGGDKQANVSEFGNVTYSLLDRYLLTGTIRHDGSSKFGPLMRYGTFPSGSIGWRISKEKFMDNINWLNDLKVRASYGKIGNDAIGSGLFVDQYSSGAYHGGYDLNGVNTSVMAGLYPSQLGNPYIHWETNITTNLGADAVLFKNKLTATVNWFNRKTSDLLYPQPRIGTQGAASPPTVNIMSMTNKGFELELGYNDNLGAVKYELNGNIATYRNKVTYINGQAGSQVTGNGFINNAINLTVSEVGQPASSFYGYQQAGIFQDGAEYAKSPDQSLLGLNATNAAGHFRFKDVDGNDTINSKDQTFIGNPNPKFTYGFNLNLYYKNFDLGVFFQGVSGNKIFNYWRAYTVFPGKFGAGSTDTWTTSNTGAALPIYTQDGVNDKNDVQPSSFFVEDGSYLRLKNLQIGYTFPKIKGISKLRLYVQAYNLFTITGYSGLDPEISDGNPNNLGIDFGGAYPLARKILVGVNIGL